MKYLKLFRLSCYVLLVTSAAQASAMSVFTPPPRPDPIVLHERSWTAKALRHQENIQDATPISQTNMIGTHNSYNSRAYRSATRYLDPQQKHDIENQLRLGARFIELDVHWSLLARGWPWQWQKDLLLCHGKDDVYAGVHLGCSLDDRPLYDALKEVQKWLQNNPDEVMILYIEDHSDGQHARLYSALMETLGSRIYQSYGCRSIRSNLSRADVRAKGKQVVLWIDRGCSGHAGLRTLAHTGLGAIERVYEDQTLLSEVHSQISGRSVRRIDSQGVRDLFGAGANIVALDNITYGDDRLEAAIWSWNRNQPDNRGGHQNCAVQRASGRWDDEVCTAKYHFACESEGQWRVSAWSGKWQQGGLACSQLGNSYRFAAPVNSLQNEVLREASRNETRIWIKASDQRREGKWVAN